MEEREGDRSERERERESAIRLCATQSPHATHTAAAPALLAPPEVTCISNGHSRHSAEGRGGDEQTSGVSVSSSVEFYDE